MTRLSKTLRDLGYCFRIFERSYAVPHLCKILQPRYDWFMNCDGGHLAPLPPGSVFFSLKKAQAGYG